jgi:hypothetical protein
MEGKSDPLCCDEVRSPVFLQSCAETMSTRMVRIIPVYSVQRVTGTFLRPTLRNIDILIRIEDATLFSVPVAFFIARRELS